MADGSYVHTPMGPALYCGPGRKGYARCFREDAGYFDVAWQCVEVER